LMESYFSLPELPHVTPRVEWRVRLLLIVMPFALLGTLQVMSLSRDRAVVPGSVRIPRDRAGSPQLPVAPGLEVGSREPDGEKKRQRDSELRACRVKQDELERLRVENLQLRRDAQQCATERLAAESRQRDKNEQDKETERLAMEARQRDKIAQLKGAAERPSSCRPLGVLVYDADGANNAEQLEEAMQHIVGGRNADVIGLFDLDKNRWRSGGVDQLALARKFLHDPAAWEAKFIQGVHPSTMSANATQPADGFGVLVRKDISPLLRTLWLDQQHPAVSIGVDLGAGCSVRVVLTKLPPQPRLFNSLAQMLQNASASIVAGPLGTGVGDDDFDKFRRETSLENAGPPFAVKTYPTSSPKTRFDHVLFRSSDSDDVRLRVVSAELVGSLSFGSHFGIFSRFLVKGPK
jgi:endonuclease/exonuclease/phosphatase family metal-dependent hydrolase